MKPTKTCQFCKWFAPVLHSERNPDAAVCLLPAWECEKAVYSDVRSHYSCSDFEWEAEDNIAWILEHQAMEEEKTSASPTTIKQYLSTLDDNQIVDIRLWNTECKNFHSIFPAYKKNKVTAKEAYLYASQALLSITIDKVQVSTREYAIGQTIKELLLW